MGLWGAGWVKNFSVEICDGAPSTAHSSFTFTNSVDPDEMQQYAAFHLGLHCLQKYSFRGFPNTKGSASYMFFLPTVCLFLCAHHFQ